MTDFRAQIRSLDAGDSAPPGDPSRFVLSHHRAGSAELGVETLSGGHLLHLAVAGCVFNSVFRIAADRGIVLRDCRISVDGGFDNTAPRSSGISYDIELAGSATEEELTAVAREADADSTIPNLLRESTAVVLRTVTVG